MSGSHQLEEGSGSHKEHTQTYTHTKKQPRMICIGRRKHKDEIKLAKTQTELDLTQNLNPLRKEE